MTTKILLTSFDIWKTHHLLNASDQLLEAMSNQNLFATVHADIALLRKLPVDFQLAPQHVIAQIEVFQPEIIVCCGMAESRSRLTLESNGKHKANALWTAVAIDQLVKGLTITNISHDAGNFVCNHLYYSVLKHLQKHRLNCQCLFVHVPILDEVNLVPILKDFLMILQFLQQVSMPQQATL